MRHFTCTALLVGLCVSPILKAQAQVRHAPSIEQCRADQRWWLSKLEAPNDLGTADVTFYQLNDWGEEMLACVSVDPQFQFRYDHTMVEIYADKSTRLWDFFERHKAGLFLTLAAVGCGLFLELTAKQAVGIALIGIAFSRLIGTLTPRTLVVSFAIMLCAVGLCVAAAPVWGDWNSTQRSAAQYDLAIADLTFETDLLLPRPKFSLGSSVRAHPWNVFGGLVLFVSGLSDLGLVVRWRRVANIWNSAEPTFGVTLYP